MNNEVSDFRNKIEHKILKTYKFGSRVYKTNTKESDYDFILVVESDERVKYNVDISKTNFVVYDEQTFIEMIKEHRIEALECIFQNENDKYLKHFVLDLSKLRKSVSSVASNSFVKCKKKVNQGDIRIGKKSLFHSLRILNFGIQISISGRIQNYSSANKFYDMIFDSGDTWEELNTKFKPIYNSKKSAFKNLAPLGETNNEA